MEWTVVTRAWNPNTGVFEVIEREPCPTPHLVEVDLSATDLGCAPGALFRVDLEEEDVQGGVRIIDSREVIAR